MIRIVFTKVFKSSYSKKISQLLDLPAKLPINYVPVEDSYSYRIKYLEAQSIRNVLVVKKPNDETTSLALQLVSKHLNQKYKCNVIVEPHVPKQVISDLPFIYQYSLNEITSLNSVVDLVVALGGDGSILHVSSLFNQSVAPPLLSFAMGNLGFLLPFRITDYAYHFRKVFSNAITLVKRDRLTCQRLDTEGGGLFWNGKTTDKVDVVNEVNIHRGSYPNLTTVSCWVDGHHLTNGVADGLLVATPTGSTAYSLSAGGPIVHPLVETLLLTPICPRSLSFRPVLLPLTSTLKLTLDGRGDSVSQISLDGRDRNQLNYGESIQVKRSDYPIYSIDNLGMAEDWGNHINRLLKWNQNFSGF